MPIYRHDLPLTDVRMDPPSRIERVHIMMAQTTTLTSSRFVFPRWVNFLLPMIVIGAVGGAFYLPVAFAFGASPKTLAVGYAPEQPVP